MNFGQLWMTTQCSGLCNYMDATAKTQTTFYNVSLKGKNRYMHRIGLNTLENEISEKTYFNH